MNIQNRLVGCGTLGVVVVVNVLSRLGGQLRLAHAGGDSTKPFSKANHGQYLQALIFLVIRFSETQKQWMTIQFKMYVLQYSQ